MALSVPILSICSKEALGLQVIFPHGSLTPGSSAWEPHVTFSLMMKIGRPDASGLPDDEVI